MVDLTMPAKVGILILFLGTEGRRMETLYQRINAGEFENKVPWTERGATRESIRAWQQGNRDAEDKFRAALEEEFGVAGHPKAQRCFELAWEHGHASGYSEVYNYYVDFVELIQEGNNG